MKAGPILVVDDDPAILSVVALILEMEGYPVATASNGIEALAAVQRLHPSLVVLDLGMPLLDGWGFARALKAEGLHIPLIVMTATTNPRLRAEEVGASAYVSKPFEMSALLSAVRNSRLAS